MNADLRYSLGMISPDGVDLRIEIDANEYAAIVDALGHVDALSNPPDLTILLHNFHELESVQQFVTVAISLGRSFATIDRDAITTGMMSAVVNWLTATRLFVDHQQTDVVRAWGRNSDADLRFKRATNTAFDDRPGYRFACKLRNYVQHCGFLPIVIQLTRPDRNTPRVAPQKAELLLQRDKLLERYDGWGALVTRDLRSLPPTFPLMPLALDAMDGIADIHGELLRIRLQRAMSSVAVLRRVLERVRSESASGLPAAFVYREHPDGAMNLTPHLLQPEAIEKLGAVVDGAVPVESLISMSRPVGKLDPAVVGDILAAHGRGVDVLTAAYVGGVDACERALDEIAARDGSHRQVAVSLVNVSNVLAQMTAIALGTSPQGLIAGLVDQYAAFAEAPDDRGDGARS